MAWPKTPGNLEEIKQRRKKRKEGKRVGRGESKIELKKKMEDVETEK